MSDTFQAFQGEAGRAAISLLDTLRVGAVMLDTDGHVMLWSPAAQEILGWPGKGVIGRHYGRYLVRESTAGDIRATLRREGCWRGILRVRHLDGHTVEVEGRVSLLTPADGRPLVLANIVETSRLRTVEQDLAALDALFFSSPLGIALFDTERRYVRVNEALARLSGKPVSEILGRTVHEVLPRRLADDIARIQSTVLRTGRSVVDTALMAPDGHGWHSVSYSRLTTRDGRVLGIGSTVMDISERRDALQRIERARQRLKLLDDIGIVIGDLLDVRRISSALADALVPRFADYAGVMLHSVLAHHGELPRPDQLAQGPLLQLGTAARYGGPVVEQMLREGQEVVLDPESVLGGVLASATPRLVVSQEELLSATYPGDPKVLAAIDLGVHSLVAVPLLARGTVLGLLGLSRGQDREPFDRDDLALTVEVAARAAISLDNARLYVRERESALMLQRSLLPQRVPSTTGVQVAHRYVPASSHGEAECEAGGDWFDVIPLAGGRVALVVGDVIGHGLRAAATMGRIRTAVRTLAGLDLSPDELLRRVNDLSEDFAQGPEESLTATCVYAVYDPSTRRCTLARAGHVPPLLLVDRHTGGWTVIPVEAPSGAPLGIDGVAFETVELEVEEGTVLVLYTDGLIEQRGEDITEGLDRLVSLLGRTPVQPCLENVCDRVLASLEPDGASGSPGTDDDVALLLARLGGLPEDSAVSWTFPAEAYAVRRVREAVRRTLRAWGLE
ncbi:MAG TPA: SpoIIE family protein phosphatase, partial [Streptomyces sp.]|nr:SpoIIE family protein phosphatase [Streptomyces sp.]